MTLLERMSELVFFLCRSEAATCSSNGLATGAFATAARGGQAGTSGRSADDALRGWNHLKQYSQPRIHAAQERLGAAVSNSVWCSPAGQVTIACLHQCAFCVH